MATLLPAQESQPATTPVPRGDTWTRELSDPAKRGTLEDRRETVRGDSGKWRDDPLLQVVPPIDRKPAGLSLDDWADQLADEKARPAAGDEHWLVFRTRQLDDNDRVWVEKIERRGNAFTVVMREAIWQGFYQKTFTCYEVLAVNLGNLAPGDYTVKWIVQPSRFARFEGAGQPKAKDSWPKDAQASAAKPLELSVAFTVPAGAP